MSMNQSIYMEDFKIRRVKEIVFLNGKFKEIMLTEVQGKEPLDVQNMRKFKKIVELYRDDIIRKWIDFFVYNIEISPEKITKKL